MKKALDMVKAAEEASEPVFVLRAKDKHALHAVHNILLLYMVILKYQMILLMRYIRLRKISLIFRHQNLS